MCISPLLMMGDSDSEIFHTPRDVPSKSKKRNLTNSPQFLSQPEGKAKKLRSRTQSVSVTNDGRAPKNSQHVSVVSLESFQIHCKIDKLVTMVTNIEKKLEKVDMIEKTVSDIQEKILLITPPVNTEVVLHSIQSELQEVKSHIEKLPTREVLELSTQESLVKLAQNTQSENSVTSMETGDPENQSITLKEVIPNIDEEFLKPRSREFYKQLHNGDRLEIHKEWLLRDPPFIPPNYLPKKLQFPETNAEYKIRKTQKMNDLDSYMKLLQVKRDIGKASYENIDIEVNKRIEESNLSPENKDLVVKEYIDKIVKEENVNKKKWESGKKGITDLPERAKDQILEEDGRVYKVVNKKNGKTKKSDNKTVSKTVLNNQQKNSTSVKPAKKGKVKNTSKDEHIGLPIATYPMNFGVPPPQYPFQWVYPQIVQR